MKENGKHKELEDLADLNDMFIGFCDETNMKKLIKERFDSKEWLIIPSFSEEGLEAVVSIWEEFFLNKNNKYFELMAGCFLNKLNGAFCFARRSEIPIERVREIFYDMTGINSTNDNISNLIILTPIDCPYVVVEFILDILNEQK